MKKTVRIACNGQTAQRLAKAIRAYTDTAYPEGGSECAQVARSALLDTAASCDAHESGDLLMRRRQLALLRACVRWFVSEEGPGDVESGPQLISLLAAHNKSTT